MQKVIAIYSPGRGCGKTTLATMIIDIITRMEKENLWAYIDSFAEPIKDALHGLFHDIRVRENKDTPLKILDGHTPRQVIKVVADAVKSFCGRSVFAKILVKKNVDTYTTDENSMRILVIDDLRFPEELKVLREVFGEDLYVVSIYRNQMPDDQDPETENLLKNEEDYMVLNNYSLGYLYDEALHIVRDVIGEWKENNNHV